MADNGDLVSLAAELGAALNNRGHDCRLDVTGRGAKLLADLLDDRSVLALLLRPLRHQLPATSPMASRAPIAALKYVAPAWKAPYSGSDWASS